MESGLKRWSLGRTVATGLVIGGLVVPSPIAWAQLADVDPVLHLAVEALVASDPEVASNSELAGLVRQIAEDCVLDPRERAAVTQEVIALQREGVDITTVIPEAVRDTARERFTQVQGDKQKELERLRSTDPEKAKEVELMMREGERQMQAFESGERYTPSAEMMEHARDMFGDWKESMLSQGAPPEMVARAEYEFTRWTSGTEMAFGGPGHEMMGGHGGPPSVEQMQAMGMTADQIQAATAQQQYIEMGSSGHMPTLEQMQAMGMSAEQIQMAQQYEASSNFGVNPSTGGWEPNMGGAVYGGGMTDWSAGGGTYGGGWEGGSNFGINPATGGWEPGMGGGTVYSGGWESTYSGGTTYSGSWESTTPMMSSNTTDLRQDLQSTTTASTQERYETATHVHEGNVNHEHTIHVHTDGTRHDHTATSPADVATGAVFQ